MLHLSSASWRAALGALAVTVSLVAAPVALGQGRAGLPDFT